METRPVPALLAILALICTALCTAAEKPDANQVTTGLKPGQGQATPEMRATIAALNAVNRIIQNEGGAPANPEAFSKQIESAVGQVDLKTAGVKASSPLDTPADTAKLASNLTGIQELFERANRAWELERFREAAQFYRSVSMATVPGSEAMSAQARKRLIEYENMGKQHLQVAIDAGLLRDLPAQARELSLLAKEFPDTAAGTEAKALLSRLRNEPSSAASLELEEARSLEAQGRILEAIEKYQALSANPHYASRTDCQVSCLKAKRRAQELAGDGVLRLAIEARKNDQGERQAKVLLAHARNLLLNKMPAAAREKLKLIAASYPDTPSGKEAKRELEEVK